MSDDIFDAIIIGAGPAGIACAYVLAKEGKNVLVIERGYNAGSKNVTGGRVYTYALELVDKGLYCEAALERKVVHEQIMVLDSDRALTIDYHDPSFNEDVPQSYSILRAVFDNWFAGKAEEQGAMFAYGIRVDNLIEQNGKIVGVVAGEDEIYANIVVAADGVNSLTAQKAGLRSDITAGSVGVGIKEIIELPAKVIEERFNLNPNEGAARVILGCTAGMHGGGFIYTNRDSISLGCVFMPEELAKQKTQVHELFQDFKMHPSIYHLIAGGVTTEYSAHLVPEDGWKGVSKRLYREGMLLVGDAAGFVINTGVIIRGIDLAIVSGVAAARAVLRETNSVCVGPAYMEELGRLNLIATMKATQGYSKLLDNSRLYSLYPRLANDIAGQVFGVSGSVPEPLVKGIKRIIKENVTIWQLIKDAWRGYRLI